MEKIWQQANVILEEVIGDNLGVNIRFTTDNINYKLPDRGKNTESNQFTGTTWYEVVLEKTENTQAQELRQRYVNGINVPCVTINNRTAPLHLTLGNTNDKLEKKASLMKKIPSELYEELKQLSAWDVKLIKSDKQWQAAKIVSDDFAVNYGFISNIGFQT